MSVSTYVDDHFENADIIVTVPEGTVLSDAERRTISRVAGQLDSEVCFALISERTCVMLYSDAGRYGFDHFSYRVGDEIERYEHQPPDFTAGHIGGGEYLLVVFDSLIRLVVPGDYPEPPPAASGRGVPVGNLLDQRHRAFLACASYVGSRTPLAMVMPRNPVYHGEYDEELASWVPDDDWGQGGEDHA